jgi:hypothetical protein
MKELHKPLEDGRIPLVEIANILFDDWIDELDSNIPEFDNENRLLTSVVGDKNGCGVNTYLFFDPDVMLFKELYCDKYWTGDRYKEKTVVVDYNQLSLIKLLIEMGVLTNEEINIQEKEEEEEEEIEEVDIYVDKIHEVDETNVNDSNFMFSRFSDYWNEDKTEWKQPPVRIKHGDLVDVYIDEKGILSSIYLGRYIGKGLGVVTFYDYSEGQSYHIGKVVGRGWDKNPRLVTDEELFNFIED